MNRWILLLIGVLPLAGCGAAADVSDAEKQTLSAVATTGPVGDALRRLAGERIEVNVLMGPGVDPHLYREKPSDMIALAQASVVVHNGLHLEGRLADVLEGMAKKKTVISMAGGLETAHDPRLISPEGYDTLHDPHVWHDVRLWSECVQHLCDQLVEFDPDGAEQYRARCETFRKQLDDLHAYCVNRLSEVPEQQRLLVTAHDAFAYFSRAYGLESVGLKGVSTEDEIDLGRMQQVVDLLVERRVPAVFVESAVAPKVVEALVEPAAERGHTLRIGGELYADAMGPTGSGADDYLGMIRANVETIASALQSPATAEEPTP